MNKEVLINAGAAEIRVAIVEDGRLQELFLERLIGMDDGALRRRGGGRSGHSLVGNIVLGRVQRVLPGMQAAFVDIGLGRAGFLGAREARCLADLPGSGDERAPRIAECVREGEEVLVQIDDREALEAARAYCRRAMPEAEGKLHLFGGPETLFESFGLEEEIERLARPRVPLPSGGWITIEGTEALTAIDVNSGSFTE